MLIQLQRPEKNSQDALSWLLSCHERIRHFTKLAQTLAASTKASEAEIIEAARAVHRYFTVALPLHEQDEEESLSPKIFGRENEIDDALSQMKQEHRAVDSIVAEMTKTLQALIDGPSTLSLLAKDLHEQSTQLSLLWETHLKQEEELIFPFAKKLLDETQLETLRQEMRSRRG
jgi:hemerythrin-like domain-containing protein